MRAKVNSIELGGATNLAVLARIKPGFVPGFETITYLDRLRRLLKALHAARQNIRESELRDPVFPDPIGRFGIIHSFRYAIVPARSAGAAGMDEPGTSLLSLNVSFDGGWEPYMRVIYRDIGTLLDALFCHCVGYPGSRKASFDEYCRWVRDNEIDGGIFYTDSSVSLSDQRYLAQVEKVQRETAERDAADKAIAGLALDSQRRQDERALQAALSNPMVNLALPLRTLKGLYRLSVYFPANTDDGGVLIRFAQSLLKGFRQVIADADFKLSPAAKLVYGLFADELAWLGRDKELPPAPARQLAYSDAALQDALVSRNDPVTHGCVVMLGVRDAAHAGAHLRSLADLCATPKKASQIRHHVAFTHAGLQALRIAPERLDALPPEFVEGMEARCGLLGDVRSNHPDHWRRPLRHSATPGGDRVDLSAVHVVVMLRLIDPANQNADLHPGFAQAIADLQGRHTGMVVLAIQPTRSYREGQLTREHFGFLDGFSQPVMVHDRKPVPRSDEVRTGEVLLGYANDRGDGPYPKQADDLLDNGSFLVMRKLRQRVDQLDKALKGHPEREELLAKMMGRQKDGTPLVQPPVEAGGNAFDFDADALGAVCPFQSHVRRANPRDARDPQPRILRRGMSYGPRSDDDLATERGIVFMAYCASIAEQFETIQRWIAGGNSSGVSSSQADPFLAVPQPGEKRTFRYTDAAGKLVRADLGHEPFVQLEWGLYLFVPSLKALRMMADFRSPPDEMNPSAEKAEAATPLEVWRRRLEDPDRSKAVWKQVREQPGGTMAAPPYGQLLGTADRVLEVLRDNGAHWSVQGYGQRMHASIGLNHLGMDPQTGHSEQAPAINAAIESIDAKQAFIATTEEMKKVMPAFMLLKQDHPDGRVRVPVDLVSLAERVLAGLCTRWIGLPEKAEDVPAGQAPFMKPGGRVDEGSDPPRCPGHLLTASRYTFAPHPRPEVVKAGPPQGQAVLAAVEKLLASGRPLGPLAAAVQAGLQHIDAGRRVEVVARNIAGVMLGFPPTVYGNFLRTMETWIDEKILWACQQRLAEVPASVTDAFERAEQALRKPLLETMRQRPVPEMLWRSPVVDGEVVHDEDQRVVLGIASALTDPAAPHELMFGGSRHGEFKTLHACPGYGMGIGVMLGLIAGLLDAGTLRPTGSPVLLMLTPRQ